MTDQPRLYTYADFEAFIRLPENKNRLFELINGEIVELSPTQQHAFITTILAALLHQYLTRNPIGWGLVEARYKMTTDDANAHIPDVSFARFIEGRQLVDVGPAPYMPEFAVEIQSPDDKDLEMREKAIYYLKHGTELVWLIFPAKKKVEVHTLESVETFGMEHTLDGGDVLPGFKVTVSELFKDRPGA